MRPSWEVDNGDMNAPMPYLASGLRPSELRVYTIEECPTCKLKMKRDFQVGDYVVGAGGTCEKCHAQRTIVMIYGEKALPK